MPSGRVKFFNRDRGYGFIAPDGGGSDVFVHVHEVEAAGMKILEAGQVVSRIFRTFSLGERHPALAQAVMAPQTSAHCRRSALGRP